MKTDPMPDETSRRRELGDFLRARREALQPGAVGLPPGRRRRTPGLRREELADLAGISAVWYARIEQGREVAASPAALSRLGRALRLERAERAHLFALADRVDPLRADPSPNDGLPDGLEAAVRACAAPAYVLDGLWNVRARNAAALELFGDWLAADAAPNLLRYVFLDPGAPAFIVDWDERARRLVAEFRADIASARGSGAADLATELATASAVFRRLWKEHHVLGREGGCRRFDHPRKGRIAARQVTFVASEAPDLKLVMLLPE